MKNRNGIRTEINAFYRTNVISWLSEIVKDKKECASSFPVHLFLGTPKNDEEAIAVKDEFLKFCEDWQKPVTSGHVDFHEKNISGIGKVQVPIHLIFDTPEDIATWAGHLVEYRSAKQRLAVIAEQLPDFIDSALDVISSLSNLEEADFVRFVDVSKWIVENHDKGGALIRKIPVRGVDTRWFEIYRHLLLDFLRDKLNLDPQRKDILQLGLVPPPNLVRICILDHVLRTKVGGMRFLASSIEELKNLDIKPHRVIFMESLSTVLSLNDIPGAVVVIPPSHALSDLTQIPWIANAKGQFIGSLDIRSFVQLHNLRIHMPKVESLLMDVKTLEENRDLCSFDNDVTVSSIPAALNESEALLCSRLLENYYGENVRLDQERLPLDLIHKALGVNVSLINDTEDNK